MVNPQTHWIWAEHPFELHEAYVRFRKLIHLESASTNARLLISGDSRYRLYVNGTYVAFGPARCYPWRQRVDEHEIGSLLQPGDNLIAAHVYQPGYSHFSYVHRAQAGLLVDLSIDGKPVLVSDAIWKGSTDPSFGSQPPRISIYGAGQEHRDLRASEDWIGLDYDDTGWPQARVCAAIGQPPWEALDVQPAVKFEQELEQLQQVDCFDGFIDESCAKELLRVDPHQVIRKACKESQPAQESAPIAAGRVRLICYDAGQSQVCSAHLEISNARGGEIVLVSYLEKGRPGAWVISDPQTYCRMRMTDRYTLAPGANTLEPFTPRGGRYILVGLPGPVTHPFQLNVRFRPRRRSLDLPKSIALEDQRLKDIAEMCRRSLQACLQEGVLDCPWREQGHWMGDGTVTCRMIAERFDNAEPLRRMLEMAVQGAAGDGVLPSVLPSEAHAYVILTYNFAWVEGLMLYYELTADEAFVNSCWQALQKMLDRFSQDLADDGLIRSQPGRRYFLDWAELSLDEPSALYNLRYLYALQMAARLAGRLGQKSDENSWGRQAKDLSNALQTCFCRDGVWYDQLNTEDRSQHVAAFAVLTGLLQGDKANELMDQAVATSLEQTAEPLILASPYMHYYLFEALIRLDRREDILAIVRFHWGRWLDQGAVTTWENWEIDFPDGSACHGWSAHPLLYL